MPMTFIQTFLDDVINDHLIKDMCKERLPEG